MLLRFDPFREFDRLAQQLDGRPGFSAMPMDGYRADDRFVVHFDLPGVDPTTIDLTVEKDVLTVSAERHWEPTDGTEVLVAERPHGRFTRQLFLADGLDHEHIDASYDAGVLTVTIPVAEHARPRKVQIHAGTGPKAIEATSTAA